MLGTTDTKLIERDVAHRPWPLPGEPWLMFQSWQDLLFAHWPVSPSQIRPLVPDALTLDLHGGAAWVGVTPFRVRGLRARMLPAVPRLSAFPEANVRTYVTFGGRPGVFFFSLDTSSAAAVLAARIGYHLPYQHADAQLESVDGEFHWTSRRDEAELVVRYRPTGPATPAEPRSLDHFLTERYALYVVHDGEVMRGDIHHRPWSLQTATAVFERNTLAAAAGITLPDVPPRLLFAARQDTLIWPLP